MNAENKKRKQAEKALQESKERFRGLAEAAFEGIGIAEGGTVIDANPQLARMLGYELDELIGMDVMACVAPASRDLVRDHGRRGPTVFLQNRKWTNSSSLSSTGSLSESRCSDSCRHMYKAQ